jgi:multidrug efflux system membrane fusion protein
VRNGGDGPFVYVLNPAEKTVSLRPVRRGLSSLDKTQILSGIEPGEQVITEGADRLTDGAKVKLPGERGSKDAGGGGNKAGAGSGEERPGGEKRRRPASGG